MGGTDGAPGPRRPHSRRPLGRAAGASLALAAAVWALPALAGSAPVACAATAERAVLVVDTGPDELRLCVQMHDDAVSGIGLIELASDQHGLDYRLGFGGAAVCRLAGVGVDDGDCFAAFPDFWGYWRGTPGGEWSWSSTGAADTVVRPGDVEGWSWGSGQDGSSHPQPPATEFSDACADPDPEPSDEPGNGGGGDRGDDGSGAGGRGGAAGGGDRGGDGSGGDPGERQRDGERAGSSSAGRDGESPSPLPSEAVTPGEEGDPVVAAPAPGPASGGPPPAGLAAIVLVAVLGAAALVLRRRRTWSRVRPFEDDGGW